MEKQLKNFLKKLKLTESTISTILGALVVVIVVVLIFNYFKQKSPQEEITPEAAQEEVEVEFEENEEGEKVPQDLPTKHKVSAGENLWRIAEKYYTSGYNWVDIAQENNLSNPNCLFADQELNIPKVAVREPKVRVAVEKEATISEESYEVKKGDNLWLIAVRAYGDGYKWPEVAKANNLANPDLILVGQQLKLPR